MDDTCSWTFGRSSNMLASRAPKTSQSCHLRKFPSWPKSQSKPPTWQWAGFLNLLKFDARKHISFLFSFCFLIQSHPETLLARIFCFCVSLQFQTISFSALWGSFRRRHGGQASTVQFALIVAALNLTLKTFFQQKFLIFPILLGSVGAQLSKLWAMGLWCGPVDAVHAEKSLQHFASASLEAKTPKFGIPILPSLQRICPLSPLLPRNSAGKTHLETTTVFEQPN